MKAQSLYKTYFLTFTFLIICTFTLLQNANSQVIVKDSSFEAGHPNAYWQESSTNFSHVICNFNCGTCNGKCIPRTGAYFVWLGGSSTFPENAFVKQDFIIPESDLAVLVFYLKVPKFAQNQVDYLVVTIDSTQLLQVTSADSTVYQEGYVRLSLDISTFADGGNHTIKFHCYQSGSPSSTSFLIDDVSIIFGVGMHETHISFSPVEIYPNPSHNFLMVNLRSDFISNSTIKIYNSNGVLVKTISDLNSSSNRIDIEHFKSGTYILSLQKGEEQHIQKIVIK